MLAAELARIEAFEKEAGGLPGPVIIEGTPGGGAQFHPAEENVAGGGGNEENKKKKDELNNVANSNSNNSNNSNNDRRGMEESYTNEGEDDFEYPPDDDDEDEDDYAASSTGGGTNGNVKKPPNKSTFWGWMEQYFANLTSQHVALLRETKVRDDAAFSIPRLGQHYAEKWGESSGNSSSNNGTSPEQELGKVGDVTARLLAALVSDPESNLKKPRRRPDNDALKKSRAEEPATMVFNRELAAQIDDKLRGTLMNIGLVVGSGLPPLDAREDDEICETIRSLQNQLKQQIKINNGMKEHLRPLVEKRLQQQQLEGEAKRDWDKALVRYQELMASKKKKGKGGD